MGCRVAQVFRLSKSGVAVAPRDLSPPNAGPRLSARPGASQRLVDLAQPCRARLKVGAARTRPFPYRGSGNRVARWQAHRKLSMKSWRGAPGRHTRCGTARRSGTRSLPAACLGSSTRPSAIGSVRTGGAGRCTLLVERSSPWKRTHRDRRCAGRVTLRPRSTGWSRSRPRRSKPYKRASSRPGAGRSEALEHVASTQSCKQPDRLPASGPPHCVACQGPRGQRGRTWRSCDASTATRGGTYSTRVQGELFVHSVSREGSEDLVWAGGRIRTTTVRLA
jgi:hypothetical protein